MDRYTADGPLRDQPFHPNQHAYTVEKFSFGFQMILLQKGNASSDAYSKQVTKSATIS